MRFVHIIILILFFGIGTLFSQSWSVWAAEKSHVDHAHVKTDQHEHDAQDHHSHPLKQRVSFNHTHQHQDTPDSPVHEHTHTHEVSGCGTLSFVFMESGNSYLQLFQSAQNLSSANITYPSNSFLDSLFRPPILNPSIS